MTSRRAVSLAWILGALVAGCAAHPGARGATLAGASAWTLTMADGACTLTGIGARATQGACTDLGEASLAGTIATDLGAGVQALRVQAEPTAGGVRGVLSTANAGFVIDVDDWQKVERQLRGHLGAQRVAERERRFTDAPACPAGQVVLTIDGCPGLPGPADVCGAPTHTCGAPLATGAACSHHAACASATCSATGLCE